MARTLFFVVVNVVLVLFMESGESVENPRNFFPSDLTLVTWSHATNSQDELAKAFADKVKMIEADMQLGTVEGGTEGVIIPIMAHPPKNTSDLSFEDFMNQTITSNKNRSNPAEIQGIKLDFKTIETVEPALTILSTYTSEQIDFPIWLNADILRGPVNSTGTPVNASEFFKLTAKYRPGDTLSIGWTTKLPPDEATEMGEYTKENIQEMVDFLQSQTDVDKRTPITFPLRAGFAAESLENVMTLLNSSTWENATITLWGSADDPVDMKKLVHFVDTVTKERCFTDLTFPLVDENSSGILQTSRLAILTFLAVFYYLA